jgi:RNA polymerase sigma-70 factor (ECF subfamily)
MSGDERDERLMERYALGDSDAMELLFRRHAPRIHAFFSRAFRDASTCEDLVQTTFLKLHKARTSYTAGAPFRPWLFTFAARTRVDELRRRYRQRHGSETSLDALPADEEPRYEGAYADPRVERVRRAFQTLPEGQRLVVLLHRYEEMTFAEVAAVLSDIEGREVRESAARVRAFRAYAALRAALDEGSDEPR